MPMTYMAPFNLGFISKSVHWCPERETEIDRQTDRQIQRHRERDRQIQRHRVFETKAS